MRWLVGLVAGWLREEEEERAGRGKAVRVGPVLVLPTRRKKEHHLYYSSSQENIYYFL
jgi:hypothetical protein